MARMCRSVNQWIDGNRERDERRVILCNMLEASAGYLTLAGENVGRHISVAALCTRSLYEINLHTRDVLQSAEGLRRWQGEAVTDKIQVFEGILSLETVSAMGETRATLHSEIARLQSLRKKYGLPEGNPAPAGKLAKSLGLAKEHEALFKLFSKLVHPSSYLVNDRTASSDDNTMVLQVHAQLYAGDTFTRISDAFSVPVEIRAMESTAESCTKN